jgi:hypothetical protein
MSNASKIVGFDQKTADSAVAHKKECQRKNSLAFAGRNIHFVKDYKLAHHMTMP